MKQCVDCGGLVPVQSSSCPNCDVTAKRSGVSKVKVATFTALLISGCFAAPVYGAPCTANNNFCNDCEEPLADGGSPKNDSTNGCYEPDGGTP